MTPQDILTADSEQVRVWVALLEGWEWVMREGGDWCRYMRHPVASPLTETMFPGKVSVVPADMSLPPSGRPLYGVPKYTTSLDAIWPVQAKTRVDDRWLYVVALSVVLFMGDTERKLQIWEQTNEYGFGRTLGPVEVWPFADADALTRARAICLCRIEELDELVKEDK